MTSVFVYIILARVYVGDFKIKYRFLKTRISAVKLVYRYYIGTLHFTLLHVHCFMERRFRSYKLTVLNANTLGIEERGWSQRFALR